MSSSSTERYRLFPAWAPKLRYWMAWPPAEEDDNGANGPLRSSVTELANALADLGPVTLVSNPGQVADASLNTSGPVSTLPLDHNCRRLGALGLSFVMTGAGLTPCLNGTHRQEIEGNAFVAQLLDQMKVSGKPYLDLGFSLSALEVDGEGTIIAHGGQLSEDGPKNPEARQELEAKILGRLGAQKVIWLDDDQGGDCLFRPDQRIVRFARPGVVFAPLIRDSTDRLAPQLREILARIKVAQDAKGRDLEVIEVDLPGSMAGGDEQRVLRSYLDFQETEAGLVAPAFEAPEDDAAFDTLIKAFPARPAVQVHLPESVAQGGGISSLVLIQPGSSD